MKNLGMKEGYPLLLKWLGRPLWSGEVNADCSVAQVLKILSFTCQIMPGTAPCRVVHLSKNLSPEVSVRECQTSQHRNAVVWHVVSGLHGGGGPTATKSSHRLQVKNSIAGTLLQAGFELSWVGKAVDQLVDKVGAKNLSSLSALPPGPDRLQSIKSKFSEASIEIPKLEPKAVSHIASGKSKKKTLVAPCPSNYRVLPDFFLDESGSSLSQIFEFRGGLQGVFMCDPSFAIPWLRSGDTISPDELVLLICGEVATPTTLPVNRVTVPCTDEQDRQVLMSCVMLQLGEKKCTLKQLDTQKIAVDCNSIVALTLWQQDWEPQWTSIIANPIQFVKKMFQDSGLVSVWGKSFRKGRLVTTPEHSSSVQMHCTIVDASLTEFLSKSGFNGVWCIPKTTDGKPCGKWRLLWLDHQVDLQQASVLAAKVASAGLAKSANRLALRIPVGSFDSAWRVIFPSVPVPESIETPMVYKIESLPYGTTSQVILDWSKHIRWLIKPLRAVGPRAWIVGTSSPPPQSCLSFNGLPLLVRLLPPRQSLDQGPIVAGPRPSPSGHHPASPPALSTDPWANYTGPKVSVPAPAPASLTGPTESKFQEQTTRIEKLEQSLELLRSDQKQQAQQLQQTREDVKTSESSTKSYLDQRLHEAKAEISQSLTIALGKQSSHFDSNLQEIKALLLEKVKRKKPEGEDEEMPHR